MKIFLTIPIMKQSYHLVICLIQFHQEVLCHMNKINHIMSVNQPLYTVPQIPENHNLKTSENHQNGTILSPMHLPYSLTPEAVPPPYPSNQGAWNNGTWTTNN